MIPENLFFNKFRCDRYVYKAVFPIWGPTKHKMTPGSYAFSDDRGGGADLPTGTLYIIM